jgi:hypothetical protein
VLYFGDKGRQDVDQCLRHLETDPAVLRATGGEPVTVSCGHAEAVGDRKRELEMVYRDADKKLYASKRRRRADATQSHRTKAPTLP